MRGRGAAVFAAAAGAAVGVGLARRRRAQGVEIRTDLDRRRDRPPPPGEIRLTVVVPAYREVGIGDTVRRLRADLGDLDRSGDLEIIVVDDGSHDGTAEQAEAAGADRVLRQPVNRGKGAAVRAGVLAARGQVVAFTDADLSYAPDQLIGLMERVEQGWDVVVGSRRHTDTTTLMRARRIREIGGRAINLLTQVVLLGRHRDTQCGLKAFRSDVGQLIFSRSHVDGFAFDVEVFHLVERYHLSLLEVPVRVQNSPRSTVKVVRDALLLVYDLFRIRAWDRLGVYDPQADDRALLTAPVRDDRAV